MNTQANQVDRAKGWQVGLYPLANGVNNMYLVVMMFISYIAAGGYGIALTVVSVIMTSTRMFDAITDPICALVTDRVKTRFGKIRILLIAGNLIMALSVMAIFFWGIGTGPVIFTLFYLLYYVGYTIFGIGYQTGQPVLTTDPVQRPRIARNAAVYMTLLLMVTMLYMSLVLMPKYGNLGVELFQDLALMVIPAGFVLVIVACIAIAEKDTPEAFANQQKNKLSVKDCWKLLKGNRAMRTYIAAASSDKLALQTASQAIVSTMLMGIIINNYELLQSVSTFLSLPALVLVFIGARQAGKLGSKKALVRWTVYSIISALIFVVFMVIVEPTQITRAVVPSILYFTITIIHSGCMNATSAVTGAMLPDIVDYEYSRSGMFMPGTVAAVYSFVDKIISSFAATIAGLCVAAIGFNEVLPQPGDSSTPQIFWMTMFLSKGLPIIGWVVTLIAMKWYPLTKEKMVEVQAHNAKVRAGIAGAGSASIEGNIVGGAVVETDVYPVVDEMDSEARK